MTHLDNEITPEDILRAKQAKRLEFDHAKLTKDATLENLEKARRVWIDEALKSGFVELAIDTVMQLGSDETFLIVGPRQASSHLFTLNMDDELQLSVVYSFPGIYLPEKDERLLECTLSAGIGHWPKFEPIYCAVTTANDGPGELRDYEVFIPGQWQQSVYELEGQVKELVKKEEAEKNEHRRMELINRLLIGKSI